MAKHLLTILDLTTSEVEDLIIRAIKMKEKKETSDVLKGKTVLLLFEKASTRTRVSFEVAINHLGGTSIFMSSSESQLSRKEPLKDTARVLSRYVDGLVVRTFGQENLEELKKYSSIPVINALTDKFHPCQVLSDLLTIYERTPDFSAIKVAWVGDGNNMAHSWINASALLPFTLYVATPEGFGPDEEIVEEAKKRGAKLFLTHNPIEAVKDAHYINTDVWASMGQEEEEEARVKVFKDFQLNRNLLKYASKQAKVMHCLPAHRGQEITEEVLEGEQSIVWDQAENRLHMQKAILERIFS